jgi:hypothetical protein
MRFFVGRRLSQNTGKPMGTTIFVRRSWSCLRALVVGVCLVAIAGTAIAAQRQSATLEGTVQDTSGAAVSAAAVTVREADTNLVRTTQADLAGSFRVADLPIGTYEVRVDARGFAPYSHTGVILTIGQTVRLVVVLQPAQMVEQVVVTAQPPPLDSRQTSVATVVDAERIEELPVRSRNYLEFVLLAPGVSRAVPSPVSGSASSVLPTSGFSFQGLRPRSNTLTIDGIDNSDEFSGSSRTELSLEVVREFQVVQNGWFAENGGAAGGINVVTRSGANTLHGDAFVFAQSGALNAPPKLEEDLGAAPALRRYRAGGAIGGPVSKDRTFYYAAAEREGAQDQTASAIDPAIASRINTALSSGLLPQIGTRALTIGLFPTERTETESSLKITHSLTGRGVVVGSVAANQNADEHDAFNRGGLSDRSARGTAKTRDVALTGSWNIALASTTANEFRGQFATRRQTFDAADPLGPGVSIAGIADFGSAYVGDGDRRQSYFEIADTATHSRGQHLLKAGAAFKHVGVTGSVADGVRGLYFFRSLDDFLAGRPDSLRQTSRESTVDFAIWRASAFIQDHWTPRATLTVDAGVRFDTTRFPSSLGMANKQVSPRAGVAWTVAPDWVVRGGAGWFADRIVLAAIERAWNAEQYGTAEQITEGSATTTSLYTVRPGAWNPASLQVSIGGERLLAPNMTAAVTYLYASGRNLPRTVNVNLPPPTILTPSNAASLGVETPTPQQLGRPVFGPARLDPSWDGIFELQPTAGSTYHGITVSLNRRLANEFEWSAAYTWSRSRDSASDFDEQPQNPYALADEWGDSRYDQRHRFVASALFDLPIGEEEDRQPDRPMGIWTRAFSHIEIAPIFTLGTGTPANAVTGQDDNRSRAFPFTSRPLGLSRNAERLPTSVTLDLRILKYFDVKPHGKLDLVVEAFNLLNRTNVSQINSVFGPGLTPLSTFGRPIEAGASRQIQFSIDFEF